jgi:hypothetical protein
MAKPKQTELHVVGAGVAPVRIPEVDDLAETYIKERDKRCKQTPREIAAKGKLIDALHKHADKIGSNDGTITYRYDDVVISLQPGKEKLKVREASSDDGDEE